jgi:protein-tyrosine phosphatase
LWTSQELYIRNNDSNFLDYIYEYSLNGKIERGPPRKLRIILNSTETENLIVQDSACFLLKNSKLEIFDVNFVAFLLDYNQIGKKRIFIGTYLQYEIDFKRISQNGTNAIINLQTDKDLSDRKLDINQLKQYSEKYGIEMIRYPIEDFNKKDMLIKLKGAGDLLHQLIQEGKIVYIHCTAGIGRSPAVVIIYLVLYENYTIENAVRYVKQSRPKIVPNYKIIEQIAMKYKSSSEL